MKTDIIDMIELDMKNCSEYNSQFCEVYLCTECSFCNKNLKYEYHKQENYCYKCHNFGCCGYFSNNFKSLTWMCNHCNGTGKMYLKYELRNIKTKPSVQQLAEVNRNKFLDNGEEV